MEYIHELTNLLNEHDHSNRIHMTSQEDISKGYSLYAQNESWCHVTFETNSSILYCNKVHDLSEYATCTETDSNNHTLTLERYLENGKGNEVRTTTSAGNDEYFRTVSPSQTTLFEKNSYAVDATRSYGYELKSPEFSSFREEANQFAQDVTLSPVCRASPVNRMEPRSLVTLFNNPDADLRRFSCSSTSTYTDEDINLKRESKNQNNNFYDVIINSDVSGPSSPSTSISGVSSFSSDEEELDFVLETACDMMSKEYYV